MSDQDQNNPYLAFIEEDQSTPSKEVAPVKQPDANTESATSDDQNPYMSLSNAEEEPTSILDNQKVKEVLGGAALGAAHKVHQMRVDAKNPKAVVLDPNAQMSAKGLQSYLNSQLNSKYNISLKQLEGIVGSELRTMSDVQDALKFVQGQEAQRIAKSITSPIGVKRNIYTTVPGREALDLSQFERTLPNRVLSAAKATPPVLGKIGRGAVAGAAAVPMAVEMMRQEEPTDWTQWSSLLGSGLGLTRSGPLGIAGLAMQAPYIVKHAPEISAGLSLGEINPTMFGASPEALDVQDTTIPDVEPQNARKAGYGRGFMNPPLALP